MRFVHLRTWFTARSGSMQRLRRLVLGLAVTGLAIGLGGLGSYLALPKLDARLASLHARQLKYNLLDARMDEMRRRTDVRAAEVLKTCNTIKAKCEQRERRTVERCAACVDRGTAEQIKLFELLLACDDENTRLREHIAETEARCPPHDGI